MSNVISLLTRKPIANLTQVIIANPDRPLPTLAGQPWRAAFRYDDMIDLIERALSAATLSADPETRRLGRQSLGDYARWAQWPQARARAKQYLRSTDRSAPGGAA